MLRSCFQSTPFVLTVNYPSNRGPDATGSFIVKEIELSYFIIFQLLVPPFSNAPHEPEAEVNRPSVDIQETLLLSQIFHCVLFFGNNRGS